MRFAKLQALGNDFLVVDASEPRFEVALDRLAVSLCDRHFGAGADGIVIVEPTSDREDRDCESRIFNADGSEAEISGNGTRCLAAYLDATGLWPSGSDTVRIGTAAGVKPVRLVGREGQTRHLEMEVGVPRLDSRAIPMALDPPLDRVVARPLVVDGTSHVVTAVSVGNPHCSLLVDELDPAFMREVGPKIERHALFPERVNVEFVRVEARDRIRVLFWERGAGETLSSGTGSSAATVAAILNGLVDRSVTVETPAGPLGVTWRDEDGMVLLSGPAELVYVGEFVRGS